MKNESFKKGIKDGIPIGLGYLAVSFTVGMMSVSSGLSIWQAVLISLTNLTSAGQFAGLDIIVAGGSYWEMALTQLVLNLCPFLCHRKCEEMSHGHTDIWWHLALQTRSLV